MNTGRPINSGLNISCVVLINTFRCKHQMMDCLCLSFPVSSPYSTVPTLAAILAQGLKVSFICGRRKSSITFYRGAHGMASNGRTRRLGPDHAWARPRSVQWLRASQKFGQRAVQCQPRQPKQSPVVVKTSGTRTGTGWQSWNELWQLCTVWRVQKSKVFEPH